jgi:uncharacterized protein
MRAHILGSLIALALLSSLSGCASRIVSAPGMGVDSSGVVVVGSGEASAAPNIVRLSLGAEIRALTADMALEQLSARTRAITAALKQLGVEEKDIQTSALNINPIFEEPIPYPFAPPPASTNPLEAAPSPKMESDPVAPKRDKRAVAIEKQASSKPQQPEPASAPPDALPGPEPFASNPRPEQGKGYRAGNQFTITVRNPRIESIGKILAAVMAQGANVVMGISYDVDNRSALLNQARDKAIANAQLQAEGIARAGGVTLGKITAIRQYGLQPGEPMPPPMMQAAGFGYGAGMGAPLQVERGEVAVTQSVIVYYAIE